MYRRPNKYKAIKTVVDGVTFDSRKEGRRYRELRLLEQAGVIEDLCLQPHFLLQEAYVKNGKSVRKIEYIADFSYYDLEKKKFVVEDVKGLKTDVYRLKKKIFEYKYPDLEISEIWKMLRNVNVLTHRSDNEKNEKFYSYLWQKQRR